TSLVGYFSNYLHGRRYPLEKFDEELNHIVKNFQAAAAAEKARGWASQLVSPFDGDEMRVRASQGIPSTWTCKPGNDGRKNRRAHPARILRNEILTRARPCADFPSNSHFFGENPRLAVVVGLLGMPPERVLCDLGEDPFFGIPVTRLA